MKEKEYKCIEVKHHDDIGEAIAEFQKNGWHLHTYQTAGLSGGPFSNYINHYLLYEKDK